LLVVDVQNDFMPGARSPCRGQRGVPVIKPARGALRKRGAHAGLASARPCLVASSHNGQQPFDNDRARLWPQVLWPDHCVQGTAGRAPCRLDLQKPKLLIARAITATSTGYSAFLEADRKTTTGLKGNLKERGISRFSCGGLATDFCVAWTALDARAAGFERALIEDACAPSTSRDR